MINNYLLERDTKGMAVDQARTSQVDALPGVGDISFHHEWLFISDMFQHRP